jgi:hypothetical protein
MAVWERIKEVTSKPFVGIKVEVWVDANRSYHECRRVYDFPNPQSAALCDMNPDCSRSLFGKADDSNAIVTFILAFIKETTPTNP